MQISYVPSLFCCITRMLLLLFCSFIPSAFATHPHPHLTNATDQHALFAFMSAITYDPSQQLASNWTPDVSFCEWRGIICSRRRQRVVSLNVSSMGLRDFENFAFTSTHALKGSAGYISPEYGLGGRVTTKGDIYSYGIVLLEMLTGKKPTNNMFIEGMNLPKWVGSAFPNQIGKVVDTSLLRTRSGMSAEEDKDLNCLRELINVGLLCTNESPEGRPTMINIVGALQSMRNTFLGVTGIPKFQSDITHLLGGSSNAHNNANQAQSSSTSQSNVRE